MEFRSLIMQLKRRTPFPWRAGHLMKSVLGGHSSFFKHLAFEGRVDTNVSTLSKFRGAAEKLEGGLGRILLLHTVKQNTSRQCKSFIAGTGKV